MGRHADGPVWRKWATSSHSLIKSVLGESSPHCVHFVAAYDKCRGFMWEVQALLGIFAAAKEDYEGGYLFNLESSLSGEIFADFVAAAKHALSEGHKDVAAVLACAALEDALARYARLQGLDIEDNSMQDTVNALKGKGLVSGAQKSLLDTMPKIRDFAMHANWHKISDADVGSVIGFVEQFLLTRF
ncbi:Uncharacterised protein [Burkholderia pseudomallei]|nr:hypothetical protein DR61_98 [Burkholderia pseudomallei]CAJ2752338.1 Uncharacterised protein [Burkholderia pseudomallei]CAJ3160439.1 Uncharacterised protein [Burkholderia pseudomallei]CAJ3265274.1 Uncharacterised protein [Burkholderia pseudomallei]CAJ3384471.1 Uncharacterised protein [Burkholderia pseudomallei]